MENQAQGGTAGSLPQKPDFIADAFGNIRDVRHLKASHDAVSPGPLMPETRAADRGRNHSVQPIPSQDSGAGAILAVLGFILLIGGVVLYIGNMSGAFPTFPYAGFITGAIGMGMIAAAMKT